MKKQSPKIKNISWGKVEVAGENRIFKDVKLFPGGALKWDWRETGTQHSPGILPEDVQELIQKGSEIIVLSSGFYNRLDICESTKEFLKNNNIEFHVLQTKKAVELYNQLCEKEKVGALIHSTC